MARFMIDAEIVGGNWVTIPKGEYRLRGTSQEPRKSECQIELDVFWDKVCPLLFILPSPSPFRPVDKLALARAGRVRAFGGQVFEACAIAHPQR